MRHECRRSDGRAAAVADERVAHEHVSDLRIAHLRVANPHGALKTSFECDLARADRRFYHRLFQHRNPDARAADFGSVHVLGLPLHNVRPRPRPLARR